MVENLRSSLCALRRIFKLREDDDDNDDGTISAATDGTAPLWSMPSQDVNLDLLQLR